MEVTCIPRKSSVLMHIDSNVRPKAAEKCFDVSRLLASQLNMVAIGIEVGSQCTLEV
jgi:hypothetical protein